jgi:preprotein translocase subunit SecA
MEDLRAAVRTTNFSAFADLKVMMKKEDFVKAWHQVFGNLVQGELQIGNEAWNTIGNQTVYPALQISKISNEALQQLLREGHLPAGGIDFQNLPQGFVLINDDKKAGGRILHYDAGYKKGALIAPTLAEKQSPTPLIIDTVEEVIATLPADHSLKTIWDSLNKSTAYDAKKNQIFREVVLDILNQPRTDQDRLIELCGGVDDLDLDRLKSFFKNRSELASLSKDPFDAANILNVSLVDKSLNLSGSDIEATRAGLIHLAAHAGTAATTDHPLFSIIKTPDTARQLREALDKYHLTPATLNDLTRVYSSYGPEGVNKVLTSWQAISELKAIKPEMVAQIIANSEPLKDIILSQNLQETCKRLNDFGQNKREWFLQLYANHSPKSDKNFVALFKSFTEFSRKIENENQLNFYTLAAIEHPFTANIDMRTAMGRISTILDACKKTDLGAQWARIAEIDLGPAAAINAVRLNKKNRQCSFVIPEMEISQDNEDLRRVPYDTAVSVNAIAPKTVDGEGETVFNDDNAEEVQKRFFRYVAHQEYRMPLAFYTRAVAQIEEMGKLKTKIDRSELNTLYKLLAETTTGKNYQYFVHNEQKAEEQWGNILENIKNSQLKLNFVMYAAACKAAGCDVNTKIYKELIANLGKLNSVPSIEVMDKLVILMTSSIAQYNKGTIGLKEFQSSMERLNQSDYMLGQLTNQYHNKIYMGMKFYDAASYEKLYAVPESMQEIYGTEVNLFDHHTLVAYSIAQKNEGGFDQFAIPLISTFGLEHDNIEALYALHQSADSPIKSSLMASFGSVLLDIQDNKGLSADSLRTIMGELLQDEGVFAQIEASIRASFSELPELEEKLRRKEATEAEIEHFGNINLIKMYLEHGMDFDDGIHRIINKLAKNKIAEFLETNALLKAALPEGYVDRLKAQKATGAVALRIEELFKTQELKEQIEKIRIKFSGLPEEQQLQIINDASSILNQCDTESERQEVATTLANQQLLSEGAEAYSSLLNAIKSSGSSPFVYYMQQAQLYTARNNDTPIQELCDKAAYFIRDAIPTLASRYKNLNVVEFAPLIASVISAGRQKELSAKVEVGDSFAQWQRLSTELSAAKKNPDELERIIGSLELGKKSAITDLNALQDHLNKLKNPTIIKTKVDTKEEEVKTLGTNSSSGLIDYAYETRQVTRPTNALRRFGAIFGVSAAEETVNVHFKITTTHKEVKDPAHLNEDLVNQVLRQVQEQEKASVTYGHALTESIAIIDKLIESYPSAKSMLLPLTKNYLEHKGDALADEAHIKKVYGNLKNLAQELAVLNNKDMVISLCEHFSAEGKFKFTDLMTIFNGGTLRVGENNVSFAGYPTLDDKAKKQLFTVITSLLNNKKTCKLEDIEQLITHLNGVNKDQYLEAVTAIYNKAPYPELSQFNQWAEVSPLLAGITREYNTWSKKPVAREDGSVQGEEAVNGFNLEYAKEQRNRMSGIGYTDKELQHIKDETEAAKDLTTNQLLERINEIRANPEAVKQDPTELVAVMAELLYRTKGMPQEGIGNSRKWGNSFEINTTQYLAVHSLLKSEQPTIAGIGTGEGKSRIMMISLAAQWALGRTVDFVTADVTLATRDYLEYQAYFKSFGAQTNLITAQTPVSQYCKDGINFSDASNLSLFRNKARSQGLGDEVINPMKENRCLLLDEADKTLFDTIDTRYNYSAQADQSIQDMPWIYESLVKFFKDPDNEALFHGPTSNADECNRKFKEFVKANLTSEKDIQKLEKISRSQLESWQASAITALNLDYGKDFTLEANVPIVTKKGPGIVSQARLISGGAASKNAKFSFGVHQCLHARLNLERTQVVTLGPDKGNLLHEELNQKKYKDRRFPVDSENQIIYSSTSKALVDDYNVIRGVTGTPGAWTERAEKANMAFIDIPRHRGINRIDRPYQLAKDNEMQFQQIIAEIRVSITKDQPILLICKNDKESKQLYDYLEKNLTAAEKRQLHRVSADTSIAEESEHVDKGAGKSGAITVTTARMGRGTDIRLHGEAKTNGLHVIGTYLPRERDYIQIIGRAGRFGAQGSSRLILSEESMRENFNCTGKVPQEFYTATESYLDHLKMAMDMQAQKQRIIKDAVSDFRMNLTTSFFDQFFKPLAAMDDVNHDLVIDRWRKFFDASDKIWNETWPKISEALANKKMDQVESLLQDYHAEVQGYWKGMIEELKMDFADNKAVNLTSLPENVGNIKLSQRGIELLKYDVGTNNVFKTHIADRYDESYRGRAVILKGFFQNLWHNVLPSIFSLKDTAYTQARKNGNMSWSQFLLGGNLGKPVQTTENKFVSTLNDKKAMELVDIGIKGSSTAKIFNLGVATPLPTSEPLKPSIKVPSPREREASTSLLTQLKTQRKEGVDKVEHVDDPIGEKDSTENYPKI